MSDYDIIIELNKDFVPRYELAMDSTLRSKHKPIKESIRNSCLPVVDFDPPQLLLKELRVSIYTVDSQ